MSYRYICHHCGRKFELPEPEAKECPFCYWSSSVKREDQLEEDKKNRVANGKVSKPGQSSDPMTRRLKYFAGTLLLIGFLAGLLLAGVYLYKKFSPSLEQRFHSVSIPFQKEIKTEALPSPAAKVAMLSPQEQEALRRPMTISVDRVPSPEEQTVLDNTVKLQTGWSEGLPSPVWTLDQYLKLIQEQEAFYKMPFARSYKKKLEDLFKTKYLAGNEAFSQGDSLAARNLWMESLAFPLYSQDIQKHRAVALTMLRPFINDTLAKISAMNQSLADQGKRAQEQQLSLGYQSLMSLIARKDWKEALIAIEKMDPIEKALRQSAKEQGMPPTYPPSFAAIDQDIQRALMELMAPKPASMADLQPLQQDLVEKKDVLMTFTEEYTKNANEIYQKALDLIRDQKWPEAIQTLESIQGPLILQEEAAQKIALLKKITEQTLDSPRKTS